MFIGIPRGEEFLGTLHPLFTTLHPGWFSGGCVISLWFTLFLLLKEIGYVVETVSIFGRTTAVIQTYDAPSSGMPSGFALQFTPVGLWNRWRVVKSGWRVAVNSSPLGMPINTGGRRKGEEWRVKACSLAEQKNGAQTASIKGVAYFSLSPSLHFSLKLWKLW